MLKTLLQQRIPGHHKQPPILLVEGQVVGQFCDACVFFWQGVAGGVGADWHINDTMSSDANR